jgi:hypothetical protein
MTWVGSFSSINLGTLDGVGAAREGSSSIGLETSGQVEISADNTSTVRLTGPSSEWLETEYGLDVDGTEREPYTTYDSFLQPPVTVEHTGAGTSEFQVKLKVRATHPTGEARDAGTYTATQTLTASWVGT